MTLRTVVSVILLSTLLFIPAHSAHAGCGGWLKGTLSLGLSCAAGWVGDKLGDLGNAVLDAILHAIESLLGLIASLFWALSEVGARFLTWILTTFSSQIAFADNPLVQNGWLVVRDIANWFFIVLLMVAAFGTVLNIPNYNARQILPALIIIALLINFSLFIAGFFVNVSQTTMLLFVKGGAAPYGDVGLALHQGMKMNNLKETADAVRNQFEGRGSDLLEEFPVIVLYLVNIALAFGSAFIFFFLAIMFIVRVIFIWILMITSPLAFAARILPKTKSFYDDWMSHFFNWNIFGVIATFFVWLATWLTQYLSTQSIFNEDSGSLSSNDAIPASIGIAGYLMQYITIFIFLWLAIKFSRKFASQAANIATGAVAGAAVGLAIPATARTVSALRQSAAARRAQATAAGTAGRAVSRIPVLRGLAPRALRAEEAYSAARGEAFEEARTAPTDNVVSRLRAARRGNVHRQRGLAEALVLRGQAHRVDETLGDGALARLQRVERQRSDSWVLRSGQPNSIHDAQERQVALRRGSPEVLEGLGSQLQGTRNRFMGSAVRGADGRQVNAMHEFFSTVDASQMQAFMRGIARVNGGLDEFYNSMRQNIGAVRSNPLLHRQLTRGPMSIIPEDIRRDLLGGAPAPTGRG